MVEYVADHVDYHLDVQAFGKAVRAWILCHAISWTRMTNTVKFFMTNFTEEDATIFHINLQQLCLEMDHTLDPMNWDFLRHLQGSRAQEGNIADCHRQCHSWMQKWLHNQTQDVPAQMGRTRIVLHAFSGRRRLGDLQYYLEKDLPAEASFDLVVVSLDIVINAHWGDATREDTRRLWLTATSWASSLAPPARHGLVWEEHFILRKEKKMTAMSRRWAEDFREFWGRFLSCGAFHL